MIKLEIVKKRGVREVAKTDLEKVLNDIYENYTHG